MSDSDTAEVLLLLTNGRGECTWDAQTSTAAVAKWTAMPPRRGQPPPCRGNGRQKAPQKAPPQSALKKAPAKKPPPSPLCGGGSSTGSGQGASAGSPPGPSHGTAFMASPRPKPPLLAEQSIESQPATDRAAFAPKLGARAPWVLFL